MRTNTLLWIAQGLLAAVFLFAGGFKLVAPAEAFNGPIVLPVTFLRFIGTAELVGAIGLIVPWLTGIRPALTPLAAAGLVVIMIGATTLTTVSMGVGPALFPLIVGGLAASVACGRGAGLVTSVARRRLVA
jgi:hypothetical protein